MTLKKECPANFLPFCRDFGEDKSSGLPLSFYYNIAKQDTSQMQTKQNPQATYIYTQRLTEIRTNTKTETYCKHGNVKIIKHNKIYIKQIQY